MPIGVIIEVIEAAVRKAANERACRMRGIGGLTFGPRHKGRPQLILAPLHGREPSAAAIEYAREARLAAVQEIRGDSGDDRPEFPLGATRVDGAL